tara:strand:- start:12361 stop:12822 length:462 start_codon:yes stop_codon:yes gene_type:complete
MNIYENNYVEFGSHSEISRYADSIMRTHRDNLNSEKFNKLISNINMSFHRELSISSFPRVRASIRISDYLYDNQQAYMLGLTTHPISGINGTSNYQQGGIHSSRANSISEEALNHPCQQVDKNKELLQTVFKDGKLIKQTNLQEIRERINKCV